MKKTVQIVIVPMGKTGWAKGDLLARTPDQINQYMLAEEESTSINDTIWQAQQLLVLSDDEIQAGDIITDKYKVWKWNDDCSLLGRKKVIASYPQLKGTLSISKETVQAWIDAGTPGEGSVEIEEIRGKKEVELCSFGETVIEFDVTPGLYHEKLDHQGNLLLEFGKPIDRNYPEEYELTQEEAKEWCESIQPSVDQIEKAADICAKRLTKAHYNFPQDRDLFSKYDAKHCIDGGYRSGDNMEEVFARVAYKLGHEAALKAKPSIPTDEEIKKRVLEFKRREKSFATPDQMFYGAYGYEQGYKQALKDLGYE